MITYKFTTLVLGIITAGSIFLLIRKNMLYIRYALWWVWLAVIIFILGAFPESSDILAKYAGVNYPPTLILTGAVALLFVKVLLMDIDRSRQESRFRRLIQRNAILETQLEKTKEKQAVQDS